MHSFWLQQSTAIDQVLCNFWMLNILLYFLQTLYIYDIHDDAFKFQVHVFGIFVIFGCRVNSGFFDRILLLYRDNTG